MTNDDKLFAANVILAYLQMGQCPMGYDRENLQEFSYRLLEERAHAARHERVMGKNVIDSALPEKLRGYE